MHRRPLGKAHAGLWEFPGGKLENGEIPTEALVREIEEELGLSLDPSALQPSVFAQSGAENGVSPIVILLYTCATWNGVPRAVEGGEIDWFTPQQIADLDKPPLDVDLARRLFQKLGI